MDIEPLFCKEIYTYFYVQHTLWIEHYFSYTDFENNYLYSVRPTRVVPSGRGNAIKLKYLQYQFSF